MVNRPRLKTFLTIFPISETVWGLRGGADELWRIKLRDRRALDTFSAVLPYLDGRATVEEILAALAAKDVEREDVVQLLERMEQNSLLEEGETYGLTEDETRAFAGQIAFFARYRGDGGNRYQARLRARRVAVLGDGDLASSLRREAAAAGFGEIYQLASDPAAVAASAEADGEPSPDWRARFQVVPLDRERIWESAVGPPPDLLFVAQEADDPALLQALDDAAMREKMPWLLVRQLESHVVWVGPLFVPGETAEYRDLEARLRGNLSYFPEYEAYKDHLRQRGGPGSPCGALRAGSSLAAAVAVVEAVKHLCDLAVPHLAGRFLTLNLTSWDAEVHDVLRVPRLGLEVREPSLFAWKEMPDADVDAHRESEIYSRRS